MGTQCFDELVKNGLLIKDYFVITSTLRPVICFAKLLPENNIQYTVISEKLRPFGVDISDFMNTSTHFGIQHPLSLSKIGQKLMSQHPYSSISGVSHSLLTMTQDTTIDQSHLNQSSTSFETVSINNDQVIVFFLQS